MSLFNRRMSETDSRNVDMYLVNPTDIFKDDTMLEKWKSREIQNNFPLVQQYPNNDDESMMNEIPRPNLVLICSYTSDIPFCQNYNHQLPLIFTL